MCALCAVNASVVLCATVVWYTDASGVGGIAAASPCLSTCLPCLPSLSTCPPLHVLPDMYPISRHRSLLSPRLYHTPLQHPSRPGSRCQSPGRLTPVASPLPRRPRRYQHRLDVSAAAMARSRSVDAILGSPRRARRPPDRGGSEESYQGSATGSGTGSLPKSPPQSREGTPPSIDGMSSEDGLDDVDLPAMNGRSSEEEEPEEGRRLPLRVPTEEPMTRRRSQRRSTSLAAAEDAFRAEQLDPRAEECKPRPVEAIGPVAKPANGRLRLSVPPTEPVAPCKDERSSHPRTLPRSLGRSRQPPKLTLSVPSPDSPKSLPSTSSPSLSTASERVPSSGPHGSTPSDISRQNRLRKSNLVERAFRPFNKVRSKITKDNK